jgi:hypothetical protein
MSPVQQTYELMTDEVGKFLASEDFHRSGTCFRRRLPDVPVRWSICFQKSRGSTAEHISFTANVAVEWKRRPAWYEDSEPLSAWYGGAGDRIGFFTSKKNDTWWTIERGTSAELLSNQFNAVLSSCVLPFLKRFQTEKDIENYLRAYADGKMRWNYGHAITMLAFDLQDKKGRLEIEKRIKKIRLLGRIHRAPRALTDAKIQRVLKAHGYDEPLPKYAPWWKFWA